MKTRLSLFVLLSILGVGVMSHPALADTYYNEVRSVVQWTGEPYRKDANTVCQIVESADVLFEHRVDDNGNDTIIRESTIRTWTTEQCWNEPEQQQDWTSQDVYEGCCDQYLGSQYDPNGEGCRCGVEYWQYWVGYVRDWYYNGQYQYREVLGGWWEPYQVWWYD